MQKLPRPTDKAAVVFRLCISNVQDEDVRKRLEAAVDVIAGAEEKYEQTAEKGELHKLRASRTVGAVSMAQMIDVYENRLVRKGGPDWLGKVVQDDTFTTD